MGFRRPGAPPCREIRLQPFVVRVEDTEKGSAVDYVFRRSPVRIGRSARNDIAISHRFVSAWHGLVTCEGGIVRYTDLGSTNGSAVAGDPVTPRVPVPVAPGACVEIGSLRLHFAPGEGEPATASAAPTERREEPAAPVVKPGGITAVMLELVRAPVSDFDVALRQLLVPGAVVGRFELLREIGRGSFGVVFEAADHQLRRHVAFKAVRPGRGSQVLMRQERMQKEAEAVAQLSHPNIVSLFDAGTCESGPYLIFELLRGDTLHARLRQGEVTLAQALDIAISVGWALEHAHAAGVIHRDLKPANVFLCSSGPVKVLDFGIANFLGVGDLRAAGTPAYMAPEQWRETAQDPRTDVYGAAVMLAETVTGHLPYRVTEAWSAVLDPGAAPDLDAPGVPPELQALLRRALSPDPAARPRDGHAWLTALLARRASLDAAQPIAPRPPEPPPPAWVEASRAGRRRRFPWHVVVPILGAALALGALAYLLST